MADPNKIAAAEAEGAKLPWGKIVAQKIRDHVKDLGVGVAEGVKEEMHNGLNDIRHKLVEEAWFGEQVTDDVTYTDSRDIYGNSAKEPDETTKQAGAKIEPVEATTPPQAITVEDLYGANINQHGQETEPEQEL